MNYVILNGIKSTTIQGLLIQTLPPISKPQMRTQTEVIDGKDGDIVTPLGYASYDKEVTIGLYGDYNVDDVIAYFNGSGTVIFSNEHDKFYYYTIVKQIDYERLIRFKTAKVTFHVQPFKYSSVEKPLSFETDEITEITVTNTGNTTAKPEITIYGSGNITLILNGEQILQIALGNEEYITIDSAQMEAFKGGLLKNRLVTGNYENLVLSKGRNIISWVGDVTQIVISNYSRWI